MSFLHAILQDFTKGLNTTAPANQLADDQFYALASTDPGGVREIARPDIIEGAQFPVFRGVWQSKKGRLMTRGSARKATTFFAGATLSLYRFYAYGTSFIMVDSGGTILAVNETTGAVLTLDNRHNLAASDIPASFAEAYGTVYYCDGYKPPSRWNGTDSAPSRMGIAAPDPSSTLFTVVQGAGNLTGSYQYTYTYYNFETGIESNPWVSNTPTGAPPITVTGQSIYVGGIFPSPDPQVFARNIYRFGGTSTEWRLVRTLPDNTTGFFIDDVVDAELGQALSYSHDPPMAAMSQFFGHKDRLFGTGDAANPWRVYYSSYGQPEYWPTLTRDLTNDGGFFDIDATFGNKVVSLSGTGSLLLIGAQDAIYALFGDSANDFAVRKIADYGCVGKTMVRCGQQVVFAGLDGAIYSVTDAEPVVISRDIEPTLKAIAYADWQNAHAVFSDQRYLLFIPRAAGVASSGYAFDFRTASWTEISDVYVTECSASWAGQGSTSGTDVLLATKTDYRWSDGNLYNGVLSAFNPADAATGPTIAFVVATPEFELGRPSYTKRAQTLRIIGINQPTPNTTTIATVTAFTPGQPAISHWWPLAVSATQTTLLDVDLSRDLIGRRLQVTVSGFAQYFECNEIDIGFSFLRETYRY